MFIGSQYPKINQLNFEKNFTSSYPLIENMFVVGMGIGEQWYSVLCNLSGCCLGMALRNIRGT